MVAQPVFESARTFRLWRHTVSLQQMMLRSVKAAENPTCVDLLFRGVTNLSMATELDGLRIFAEAEGRQTVFRLESGAAAGQVVASVLFLLESDLEYDDLGPLWDGRANDAIRLGRLTEA